MLSNILHAAEARFIRPWHRHQGPHESSEGLPLHEGASSTPSKAYEHVSANDMKLQKCKGISHFETHPRPSFRQGSGLLA